MVKYRILKREPWCNAGAFLPNAGLDERIKNGVKTEDSEKGEKRMESIADGIFSRLASEDKRLREAGKDPDQMGSIADRIFAMGYKKGFEEGRMEDIEKS